MKKALKSGKQAPRDMQERHSPTQRVHVRLVSGAPKSKSSPHKIQRRIVDARLWESMTHAQQDAALEIAAAFEMIGRGMGYVVSNWQRLPGCGGSSNVSEAHARMMNQYFEWAEQCTRQKISHALVIDVLCFVSPAACSTVTGGSKTAVQKTIL
jgi:hypothetical protein